MRGNLGLVKKQHKDLFFFLNPVYVVERGDR